ncbi:MAG: DUF2283 domain-containing protein [Thaumarchaeota archaeon]|nr:DUF2283 domain-containing protein [Nitrososphaerota archaeon]
MLRRHEVKVTRKLVEDAVLYPEKVVLGLRQANRGARLGRRAYHEGCHCKGGKGNKSGNAISCKERKVLKVTYSTDEDILMYEVSDEPIDYAEEMDSVIVHFTKSGKPVLLEILDASKFLAQTVKATKKKITV